MSTEDPRFAGVARLYGDEGLQRLGNAHVAVVGIGGVGSWAAEALARSGVGEITLFDLDDVCVSNTNRQAHALEGQVGRLKVEVMAERLRAINPKITVHAVADFVTRETMAEYITEQMDAVIDCIDSVMAKAALIAWCRRRKIAIVTTGGAGGQIDPTQIQVGDLNKTFNDPLASRVRSTLRRDYNFSRNTSRNYGVPCVFSSEQLRYPKGMAVFVCRRASSAKACAWTARGLWCGDDGDCDLWHGGGEQGGRETGGARRPSERVKPG